MVIVLANAIPDSFSSMRLNNVCSCLQLAKPRREIAITQKNFLIIMAKVPNGKK
jgi:hypothetical protein